jgi:AcrR family transcriptional regulator
MTQPTPTTGRRPRDSAATRRALVDAARELFAKVGYDATTVRAVADKAGVNQALLFRYFGNKRGLFAEAIGRDVLELLEGPPEDLLDRTISSMCSVEQSHSDQIVHGMLLAADSTQVGEDVRKQLGESFSAIFARLAATTDEHDAGVRGELLLAWLLGIAMVRSLLPDGDIQDGEAVRRHLLRTSRTLLQD